MQRLVVGLARALWICWSVVLTTVFVLLVVFELFEIGLGWGSAQYTGKGDDRGMALYAIPAMMVFVAAVGYVTVVWPAVLRKRSGRAPLD